MLQHDTYQELYGQVNIYLMEQHKIVQKIVAVETTTYIFRCISWLNQRFQQEKNTRFCKAFFLHKKGENREEIVIIVVYT